MARIMTRAWYHIVVIGSDLSGLIFAALAARAGYRVCVLGQGSEGGRYRHEGHWFLRERETALGVPISPAISRVFSELALGLELKNRPQPLDPTIQLAMPGVRLDLARDPRLLERELEREFPGQWSGLEPLDALARDGAAQFDVLWQGNLGLPPDGFLERGALRKALRDLDPRGLEPAPSPFSPWLAHPGLAHAAHAILDHIAGLATQSLPRHVALRLWRAFRDGIYRFPGGVDGLRQMFVRKLQDQSGHYRADALAIHIEVKRSRAIAVGLAERGEAIGCEMIVLNGRADRVAPLLGLQTEPPRAHRAIINLALDPRVIPPAMAPELLLFGEDERPRGVAPPPNRVALPARSWWVSRPGAGPLATDGRPGPGVLQVSTVVRGHRLEGPEAAAQRQAALRDEALRALRAVLPWLEDGLRAIDVPEPVPLHAELDPETAFSLAEHWPKLPLSNALATSSGHEAPLGLEGACHQAMMAFHRLRRELRIKGPLAHA
jgi:phytoene dehydrogenase-like protein